jgi:spore coat protein U-like protein
MKMKKLLSLAMVLGLVLALGRLGMAADNADVTVSATVVGTCRFVIPAPSLSFGLLDQSSSSDATATANLQFWCTRNALYTLTDEANPLVADGAFSGTLASGGDTIPYSISYTNYTGSGLGRTTPITSVLTATILNADYVDAPEGPYNDTVIFTINP